MTASGVGMSGFVTPTHAGVPRVHSSLSHVSYPSADASPVVQLPRGYSYSSMPAGWTPAGREVSYSSIDMGGISAKGKEVERIVDSSRTSRSSSKVSTGRVPFSHPGIPGVGDAAPSPVESSGDSASSQDELEMKPVVRYSVPAPLSASTSSNVSRTAKPTSDTEKIHRLHPARSRRVSDPSQSVSRSPLASRTNSFSPGVPPVAALPPTQLGTAITTPDEFPPPGPSDATDNPPPTTSPSAMTVQKADEEQAPPQAEIGVAQSPSEGEEEAEPATEPAHAAAAPDTPAKGRRIQKVTRFKELERIESNKTTATAAAEPAPPSPRSLSPEEVQNQGHKAEDAAAHSTGPDESSARARAQPSQTASSTSLQAPSKQGKLSKSVPVANGKLVKKNRWSHRGAKSTVVAG
ncbi:uncharacterized protein P884DRAFT_279203 [Thermothelomyces heterothallicus CBS 202.75]|uniref:uncharacterized protein n=1 Tax=Thermothelomyces heterothallicus CBS 202.75 TaxID=1149848 RepID=UPI003741EDBF